MPAHHDDFAEFYQASYSRMVALLATLVGDRTQAEDIAQEAFSRALARWPQVARYDLPEAWVRRVALRLTIDAVRRMRRARIMAVLLTAGLRGAGRRYDPHDPLEATALSVALMRLPLPQRQALVLYYLADLPVEEIARDCGVSAGTVRTRLAAARRRLERELEESDQVGDVQLGRQRSPAMMTGPYMRPYLRVANVLDGYIDYSDVLEMNFAPHEAETFGLLPGDILLNEGQDLDLVGRCAIFDGPSGMCFQNTQLRFRPRIVSTKFAAAVFKYWLDRGEFRKLTRQTTSIAHIGAGQFSGMLFPLAPLHEQYMIQKSWIL